MGEFDNDSTHIPLERVQELSRSHIFAHTAVIKRQLSNFYFSQSQLKWGTGVKRRKEETESRMSKTEVRMCQREERGMDSKEQEV